VDDGGSAYRMEEYRAEGYQWLEIACRKAIKDGRQTEPQEWSVTAKTLCPDIDSDVSIEDLNSIILMTLPEQQTRNGWSLQMIA